MKAHVHLERGNPAAARVVIEHEGREIDFTPYVARNTLRMEDGDGILPRLSFTLFPETIEISGDHQLVIQRAEEEKEADDAEWL